MIHNGFTEMGILENLYYYQSIWSQNYYKTKLKFTARSPESPPYPEPEMYAKAALIRLEGLRPGDGRPPTKKNSFECCGYCSSSSSVCNRFISNNPPSTHLPGSRLGLRVLFLIELLLVLPLFCT